jgi:hypothetical protein
MKLKFCTTGYVFAIAGGKTVTGFEFFKITDRANP